ncbi:GtrA family protein [Modestobacter sp. VKM Ac-2984]|uniref:GtrA family protein n=1 Tax=Modestobacter sp. VKM Ac-2984 TaxID=3004138 RepID=UPI0022AA1AA4|nr:GtrA family protein [Modestobacter sp. VKM Ac-2984]MCZ2817087.1 GtrA family protein [Modestobacter sp. VKM Ac-2984]
MTEESAARSHWSRWRARLAELGAFGVVGAVCFVIQVASFQLFYAHLAVGAVTSNAAATVISMTAAYAGHRYWSFSHRARSGVAREYLLFAAINCVTLLLGLAVVAVVRYPLGQDSTLVLQVANVCSIVLGTVIRYLAYRRWVFLAATDAGPDSAELSPVAPAQPESAGPTEQTTRRAPLSS